MTPLFNKLNLGEHREILILNAPASFEAELAQLEGVTIYRSASKAKRLSFALAFVQTLAEIESATKWLAKMPGDVVVWFAYPKGSSKQYTCEFNRDTGWAALGEVGFEGVRQVAIDGDWSALRFRRVEFIKTLNRSVDHAISEDGKARTKQSKSVRRKNN